MRVNLTSSGLINGRKYGIYQRRKPLINRHLPLIYYVGICCTFLLSNKQGKSIIYPPGQLMDSQSFPLVYRKVKCLIYCTRVSRINLSVNQTYTVHFAPAVNMW